MKFSPWFLLLTAVFATCLITANILAVKLVLVAGLLLPAGITRRLLIRVTVWIGTRRWSGRRLVWPWGCALTRLVLLVAALVREMGRLSEVELDHSALPLDDAGQHRDRTQQYQ